jgi:hypothetical protein
MWMAGCDGTQAEFRFWLVVDVPAPKHYCLHLGC